MTEESSLLENRLGSLLGRGTWVACVVIAAGLVAQLFHQRVAGSQIVTAGIGIIIALPIIRVATMLNYFIRRNEIGFAVLGATVLVIVAVGMVLGFFMRF
jgi:hypothetical protein